MQSKAYIAVFAALIYLLAQVDAACTCDPSDSVCLQQCVSDGQGCIDKCVGDNTCYANCIQDFWPGQTEASSTVSDSIAPTASASASGSAAASSALASATTVVPSSAVVSGSSAVPSASILSSIQSAASSAASSVVGVSSAIPTSVAPVSSAATFSPTPPTSSVAPTQPTSGANSKPFLVPAVAIGVASITVIVQFFFLARMGTMLFH
ncbi:hypothetical protein [Parasitella parasitica]|uniref:Extracellular membrane protein CFEM domain-containing protein n=1 Tax=Parasitella parasitica TaxID=35722 RepID=A0A0B7NC86_9FUNG|nr:hypothetical protein [Parasitella parasitica]